jgi:hypothetical protein
MPDEMKRVLQRKIAVVAFAARVVATGIWWRHSHSTAIASFTTVFVKRGEVTATINAVTSAIRAMVRSARTGLKKPQGGIRHAVTMLHPAFAPPNAALPFQQHTTHT